MLVIILLNSVVVIVGFIDSDEDRQSIYDTIDYYFVIIYIVELAMKLVALGIFGYFRDNWNKLDFTLIVVTLSTDFAFSLFKVLRNARTVKATRIARINKTYRLLRVLRSFRVGSSDPPVFQVLQENSQLSDETTAQREELLPYDPSLSEPDLPDDHDPGNSLPHLCSVRHDFLQRGVGQPQTGDQVQLL